MAPDTPALSHLNGRGEVHMVEVGIGPANGAALRLETRARTTGSTGVESESIRGEAASDAEHRTEKYQYVDKKMQQEWASAVNMQMRAVKTSCQKGPADLELKQNKN